jgi:hypothetical protein
VRIPETLGAVLGIAFVANLLLTAFGSLEPGRMRRSLDRCVGIGLWGLLFYLCAVLLFGVFSGLSPQRAIRSTLSNILSVALTVLLIITLLGDVLAPKSGRRERGSDG